MSSENFRNYYYRCHSQVARVHFLFKTIRFLDPGSIFEKCSHTHVCMRHYEESIRPHCVYSRTQLSLLLELWFLDFLHLCRFKFYHCCLQANSRSISSLTFTFLLHPDSQTLDTDTPTQPHLSPMSYDSRVNAQTQTIFTIVLSSVTMVLPMLTCRPPPTCLLRNSQFIQDPNPTIIM